MAIQDVINEVNSIQSKKQAIKEAITAKGVNSEGKLSKFADEIKQISTGEPDWYMINRMRLEDGKERLLVRSNVRDFTNVDIKQLTEMGGGVYNESNSLRARVEQDLHIVNGTFFKNKESLAVYNETHEDVAISSDTHNDNYKFIYSFNGKPKKEVIFTDVNSYNYLKPFQNKPLLDRTAVYLKGSINIFILDRFKEYPIFKDIKDLINTSTKPQRLREVNINNDVPIEFMPIDSTMFIFASQAQANMAAGFVRLNLNDKTKTTSKIALDPIDQCFHATNMTTDTTGTLLYMSTDWYQSLPMGNYIYIITLDKNTYSVFVGINYVVNADGLKEKNIEVYPYRISIVNNYNIINGQVAPNKSNIPHTMIKEYSSAEWYINLGATDTIYSTEVKALHKKVLADNGTPEANASKFLNGEDVLLQVNALKITTSNLPKNTVTDNLFKRFNDKGLPIVRYTKNGITFIKGSYIARDFADKAISDNKITGFIRLSDDSNTMFLIELEEATDEIRSNRYLHLDVGYRDSAAIAPNGFPDINNKMVVFINGLKAFYIKKGNDYVTNDMLSATEKNIGLYLTSDTNTQDYIKSKPLTDILTEIQDVYNHKEEYDAYNEQ